MFTMTTLFGVAKLCHFGFLRCYLLILVLINAVNSCLISAIKRNLRGLDWEILSLIVHEGLMNAKVLKELTDADFEKFKNKINMGQWKTLKEKCVSRA